MKIVEIIPSLDAVGGAQVLFCSLCQEFLKNKDIDLHIIFLYKTANEKFNNFIQNNKNRISYCDKKPGIDFKAASKLRAILNEIKPDIVHTHLRCLTTYFLAFSLKKQSWRYFHTAHTIVEKDVSGFFQKLVRRLYINHNLMKLVTVSESLKENAQCRFRKKIYSVSNGIVKLKESTIPANFKFDFINVASFTPAKNHRLLIEAFDEVYSKNKNVKLALIGDGPLLNDCINYTKTKSCQKNVYFLKGRKDVNKFLGESKIFVLSSTREGNPISVLEAMSQGLILICPSVGGIPDLLKNTFNYSYCVGNKDELVKCMFDALYADFNKNYYVNIDKFENNYTINICAKNYYRLFLYEK